MKKSYMAIGAVVIVILLVVGYMNKHQIKTLLMGSPSSPTASNSSASSPSADTGSVAVVTTQTDSTKGAYLADSKGMTLYKYDKDTAGVSNCSAGCASAWPPYTTTSAPATLPPNVTTLTRADGTLQYAYNGMPLYYYASDTKVGDLTGDGVGGIWHLVTP